MTRSTYQVFPYSEIINSYMSVLLFIRYLKSIYMFNGIGRGGRLHKRSDRLDVNWPNVDWWLITIGPAAVLFIPHTLYGIPLYRLVIKPALHLTQRPFHKNLPARPDVSIGHIWMVETSLNSTACSLIIALLLCLRDNCRWW